MWEVGAGIGTRKGRFPFPWVPTAGHPRPPVVVAAILFHPHPFSFQNKSLDFYFNLCFAQSVVMCTLPNSNRAFYLNTSGGDTTVIGDTWLPMNSPLLTAGASLPDLCIMVAPPIGVLARVNRCQIFPPFHPSTRHWNVRSSSSPSIS